MTFHVTMNRILISRRGNATYTLYNGSLFFEFRRRAYINYNYEQRRKIRREDCRLLVFVKVSELKFTLRRGLAAVQSCLRDLLTITAGKFSLRRRVNDRVNTERIIFAPASSLKHAAKSQQREEITPRARFAFARMKIVTDFHRVVSSHPDCQRHTVTARVTCESAYGCAQFPPLPLFSHTYGLN